MKGLPDNPLESFKKRNPHLYAPQNPVMSAKRVRQSHKPLLNKLEMDYLATLAHLSGVKIHAQAMRFMLGNGHWYKPDFVVVSPLDRLIAIEVKGAHAFRGGFENLKVAADRYRWVTWKLVWKEDGQWKEQVIFPA